jgi:multisubunit Na+/H+ antiporter MnhG subunit
MYRGGISKRTMPFLAVVGIFSVYDFYRGYHQTRSVIGGIVYVFFSLILLAFFWWLFMRSS